MKNHTKKAWRAYNLYIVITPRHALVKRNKKIDKIHKVSVTFSIFFKNKRKVCKNSEIRQKKSHELNIALCDLKLNQNGPLHMGIGLIQYGVDWKSRFLVTFFFDAIFSNFQIFAKFGWESIFRRF